MYEQNPFCDEVDNCVTVWVGSLSEEELEAYVDERGGVADDEPISDFARDLDTWYDHDFLSGESGDSPRPTEELCRVCGLDEPKMVAEISRRYPTARTMLILWNARARDLGDSRTFAEGNLSFVGSWPHPAPLS